MLDGGEAQNSVREESFQSLSMYDMEKGMVRAGVPVPSVNFYVSPWL